MSIYQLYTGDLESPAIYMYNKVKLRFNDDAIASFKKKIFLDNYHVYDFIFGKPLQTWKPYMVMAGCIDV